MAVSIIFMALIITVILALIFVPAMLNSSAQLPANIAEQIDWLAIKDDELQSYLPDKKINAIKRYRDLTGCGLKEAKQAIEYVIANPDAKKGKRGLSANTEGAGVKDLLLEGRIDEAVQVYSAFMGVDEFTARDAINDLERELMAEANLSEIVDMDTIHDLLAEGKKIEAVKHYREQTGTDLASAKRAIDELE